MSQIEVRCPSGLVGRIRGLRGSELDLFANKDAVRSRKIGGQVLSTCWVETLDHGPLYGDMGDKLDWDRILVCDRFYTFFKIREATIRNGHLYQVKFKCGAPSCGKYFNHDVNLNELDVYDLPDESIAALRDGCNEFPIRLGGVVAVQKLLYGADEIKIDKNRNMTPKQLATTSMQARLVRVERGEGEEPWTGAELRSWIRDLEYEDWFDLAAALDENDGGINTEVEAHCPHCGNEMSVDFPLGSDFLTPARPKRSSKRKVRRKSRE